MMWWILAVVLTGLWALPRLIEGRRIVVDRALQLKTSGTFVELERGVTHYRWQGPVRGPVAVLIHGLTTPSAVWDDIAEGLGHLGYRVLSYDLYGRGLSDAPTGPQDEAFFLEQLNGLLDDQDLQEDLTLVGYSMGGSIATAFAAQKPHRMKQLVLIASAGVNTNESKFSKFCRRVPVIGDWLHGLVAGWRSRMAIDADTAGSKKIRTVQKSELDRQGFLRSVLSSRRGILNDTQEDQHRALGRDGVPVLAIWGSEDAAIPVSAIGELARWNRATNQEEVAGAGHGLPYTHAAEVVALMREYFLSRPNDRF